MNDNKKTIYDFDCGKVLSEHNEYRQRCGFFWMGQYVQCDECKRKYQQYLLEIKAN